jgi:hypothetical protein
MDATRATDESGFRGRRSRGVLIPRRWYQVGDNASALRWQTVARKPGSPETAKETVKTVAQGMPDRLADLW